MEEIAVVLKRFGDEQSTLLDQFERLSFEVQLNQAILARSLSEPGVGVPGAGAGRSVLRTPLNRKEQRAAVKPAVVVKKVENGQEPERRQRRIGSGLNKLLKKLLKPILGRKTVSKATAAASPAPAAGKGEELLAPRFCKAFSRSVRF